MFLISGFHGCVFTVHSGRFLSESGYRYIFIDFFLYGYAAVFLSRLFCAFSPCPQRCHGAEEASTNPAASSGDLVTILPAGTHDSAHTQTSDNSRVELHSEPSVSEVKKGDFFSLEVTVSYYGAMSYWHLKSIENPRLEGARQTGHSVSSQVHTENGQVLCEEVHRFTFEVTGEEVVRVGSVKIIAINTQQSLRHLQTSPFSVQVIPSFFRQTVALPLWSIYGIGAGALLWALYIFGIRTHLFSHSKNDTLQAEESHGEAARELLNQIELLNSSSAFENVKDFYSESMTIFQKGFELTGLPGESKDPSKLVERLRDIPNMPSSLENGLRKFVEEEKLVRFAGLHPSPAECEQVCSRLKEFIVLHVDLHDED